jgi:hypothetical protein
MNETRVTYYLPPVWFAVVGSDPVFVADRQREISDIPLRYVDISSVTLEEIQGWSQRTSRVLPGPAA